MAAKSYWDQSDEAFNPYYGLHDKAPESRDLLRSLENSALTGSEPAFGNNPPWKNNVTGNKGSNNKSSKAKGGFLKQKKRVAAMAVILSLLVGGGAFLGSSNALLAPAMEALMTDATDTQH